MYYIKIPLRNLCKPEELKVPEDKQAEVWSRRVFRLMEDLEQGVLPHWAIDFNDLKHLTLLNDHGA